ncbi:MAG: hypothetical protein LBD66_02685 [Holosporales bacterium]|nr:hypothetical protein [Holosporales bacterium]
MSTLLKQITGFAVCVGLGSAGAVEAPAPKTAPTHTYQGFYVFGGGSWMRWKSSAEGSLISKASEKNGFGLSIGGSYLHAFGNFLVGTEAGCHFPLKTILHETKTPSVGSGISSVIFSAKPYPYSPSAAIVLGYSFGANGMVALTAGGTYSGIRLTITAQIIDGGEKTVDNDWCSFRPEVGLKYAYEFWKSLGVSVEAHHTFGNMKEYKLKDIDGEETAVGIRVKTDRTMVGVNLFYHF